MVKSRKRTKGLEESLGQMEETLNKVVQKYKSDTKDLKQRLKESQKRENESQQREHETIERLNKFAAEQQIKADNYEIMLRKNAEVIQQREEEVRTLKQ